MRRFVHRNRDRETEDRQEERKACDLHHSRITPRCLRSGGQTPISPLGRSDSWMNNPEWPPVHTLPTTSGRRSIFPFPCFSAPFPTPVFKGSCVTLDIRLISHETEDLSGGVAEWSIAAVLKTAERASVPWVRIPPPPPVSKSPQTQYSLNVRFDRIGKMGVCFTGARSRGSSPSRRSCLPDETGKCGRSGSGPFRIPHQNHFQAASRTRRESCAWSHP